MADLSVGVLGPFEVTVDARAVRLSAGRQRVLLATLALAAGRVVSADALAEALWETDLPRDPRNAIQIAVLRLRRALGTDAITTVPGGYRLDVDRARVDALRAADLVRAAADAPPDEARRAVDDALALWRGDPLTGVPSEALRRDHAAALTETYLSAIERRADLDPTGHVAELRELTSRYPLRESLWQRLLTALARTGRQAEALAGYEQVRALLADSLGADPSPALRHLHRELLDGVDDDRAPHQLPPEPAHFTGRVAELAALDGGAGGVVAVHGPGGVGKTSLALRWAHRVTARYPDGQVHLDLRGYGPAEPMPPIAALDGVLRAIGVPPATIPPGLAERSALLRTRLTGRRILLLLDNARDADQVRPLLPGGDNLVLITSRSELRGLAVSDGAIRHHLRELPGTDSTDLVRAVIGAERADAEPAAVAELVELCGHLPLALVIAAQQAIRYPDWSVADSVADLRAAADRLDVLGDGGDPATDPRTVLSWSYAALDDDAARAFRYLGLHPAPEIDLPAAAALLGVDPAATRRLLDRLVSVHLVQRANPRTYHLHDLVYLFAAERAAAEPPDADALPRLLDWYLATLSAARTATFSSAAPAAPTPTVPPLAFADGAAATTWYERVRSTLLALLARAVECHHDRHVLLIAWLMQDFQAAHNEADDKLRGAQSAALVADRSGTDTDRARARYMVGCAWETLGEHATAVEWHQRALAVCTPDTGLTSTILSACGLAQVDAGDLPGAIDSMTRSVELARTLDNPLRIAHSLLNLAITADEAGRLEEAVAHNLEALAIYRAESATYHQGLLLGNLSEIYLALGRHDEALSCADEAVHVLREVDDTYAVPNALIARGRALAAVGDVEAARTTWHAAHDILRRTGNEHRTDEILGLLRTLD